VKGLPDCKQVVVGWFPFGGGEGVVSLFEEAGDYVSIHVGWLLRRFTPKLWENVSCKRRRMVAVDDCNDEDQSAGIVKGKLRVLGAFRNPSKCVGSHDGDGGTGSLIRIKLELDFHCHEQQGGPKAAADKSRYEEEQYWW
jgi:hypothetical protein